MKVVCLGIAAGYSDEREIIRIFPAQLAETFDERKFYAAVGEVDEINITDIDMPPPLISISTDLSTTLLIMFLSPFS